MLIDCCSMPLIARNPIFSSCQIMYIWKIVSEIFAPPTLLFLLSQWKDCNIQRRKEEGKRRVQNIPHHFRQFGQSEISCFVFLISNRYCHLGSFGNILSSFLSRQSQSGDLPRLIVTKVHQLPVQVLADGDPRKKKEKNILKRKKHKMKKKQQQPSL